MIYLQLLWSFFQIGLFSIGGGYAAMPLIQQQVVELNPWLTMGEFTDVVTISQMTPGPIAINAATFVGIRVAGFPGSLVATLGCVLPSCIVVLLLACLYTRYRKLTLLQGALSGLRPAVVALIASAGLSILFLAFFGRDALPAGIDGVDFLAVGLFVLALIVLRAWKVNPIWVMVGTGAAGVVLYSLPGVT
ncbi:MAG: chromate transporter [Clostridiales bacterium]|nr:chromate transporter [Clostridiales bacterium]